MFLTAVKFVIVFIIVMPLLAALHCVAVVMLELSGCTAHSIVSSTPPHHHHLPPLFLPHPFFPSVLGLQLTQVELLRMIYQYNTY